MYVQLLVWKYAFQKQAGVGKILFFSNTEKTKMMCGKMRKKFSKTINRMFLLKKKELYLQSVETDRSRFCGTLFAD
jgi:hypothetical protein